MVLPSMVRLALRPARETWAWMDPMRLIPLPGLVELQKRRRPFFSALHELLDQCSHPTLGDLLDAAGEQTYGFLILLLAMPSLIPGLNVGAAPVGGVGIMGVGWQLMRGVEQPWVPQRIRSQVIHKGHVEDALARLESYLERLGSRSQVRRTLNQRWMGFLVAWSGLLLALPIPLPFGNLLPAAVLTLQGAALLEERPFWGWLGAAGTVGISVYFGLSFDLVVRGCVHAFQALRHALS